MDKRTERRSLTNRQTGTYGDTETVSVGTVLPKSKHEGGKRTYGWANRQRGHRETDIDCETDR